MADLLDSGNPATSNWWDSHYEGDASGLGSYYSATNPESGKAESLVNAFSGGNMQPSLLPWSEYQKQLGAGTVDRYTTTSRNPERGSNLMGDYGFLLPVGGFLGSGALAAGGFGGTGAAEGLSALGEGGMSLAPTYSVPAEWAGSAFAPATSSAMTPGAWGWGAGAAAGAGAAGGAFDFGGPTGADELLGTGGPMASGGSQGWTSATGMEELMGTGGAEASGSSSPFSMLKGAFSNPTSFLQQLFQPQGGGTGGGMLGPAMSIGSGLYGMYNSEQQKKLAKQIMERSDPFAASRGMYGERLNALMNDPSGIDKVPGYAAGLQAVERKMASQGYNGSGNMMAALSKYGGDFYNQEVARLMQLSGANATPGAGSGVAGQQFNSGVDTASRALASLGYGATRASGIPMPPAVTAWLKTLSA